MQSKSVKYVRGLLVLVFVGLFAWSAEAEQDGAFGPDLTGKGVLRIGTRYKSLPDVYASISYDQWESSIGGYKDYDVHYSIYKLGAETPLVEIRNPGSDKVQILYNWNPPALSLREQEAQKKWTLEDHLKRYESDLPLVITMRAQGVGSSFLFLQENLTSGYRLMACQLSGFLWRETDGWTSESGTSAKELAMFILDNFGEKNGINDLYDIGYNGYFWKDPSRGYAIRIYENFGSATCVDVFPILGEQTLYPLVLDVNPKFFDSETAVSHWTVPDEYEKMGFTRFGDISDFKR